VPFVLPLPHVRYSSLRKHLAEPQVGAWGVHGISVAGRWVGALADEVLSQDLHGAQVHRQEACLTRHERLHDTRRKLSHLDGEPLL
jgi:hypothetical protein